MDRMLFIAMSGAKEAMIAQANNANNLANANTNGFKQDFNQFRAQHVEGPGWNSRTYSMSERPATDFTAGSVKVTGRSMDVMTPQDSFMAIQSPNGEEALIRTASMLVTPEGDLVDVKGNPMLSEGGVPINLPPFREIHIATDGTISVIPADVDNNIMVEIDQLRLVKPNIRDLEKDLEGFIRYNGELLEQAGVEVLSGALESSNVNTAQALINMIEHSRKYEMQVKMMATAKEHGQASDKLLAMQ